VLAGTAVVAGALVIAGAVAFGLEEEDFEEQAYAPIATRMMAPKRRPIRIRFLIGLIDNCLPY
jgi:hypothetical protein